MQVLWFLLLLKIHKSINEVLLSMILTILDEYLNLGNGGHEYSDIKSD